MGNFFTKIGRKAITGVAISFVIAVFLVQMADAQTTAFTYQGKLSDAGLPASGQYDLTFRLFAIAEGGTQIGADEVKDNVQVSAGIFTVTLNFGSSPFTTDTARYLEISVRNGTSLGSFVLLSPRQLLASSPFSISTIRAAAADSLSAACTSCVTDAHIASIDGRKITGIVDQAGNALVAGSAGNVTGVVQIANGGTGSSTKNFVDTTTDQAGIAGNKTFTGVLSGNGSGLTELNGANLAPNSISGSKFYFDPNVNVQQIALGRWYTANRSFTGYSFGFPSAAFTFDGVNFWAVGYFDNEIDVKRIRASTGESETLFLAFGVGVPLSMIFDGTYVNVGTDQRKLIRFNAQNPSSYTVVSLSEAGITPRSLAFDGVHIYAGDSNSVTRIRAADGTVEGSIPNFPAEKALIFDGTYLTGIGSSSILKRYQVSTGVPGFIQVVAPSFNPTAAVFDGTFVNVAGGSCGCIARVRSSPPASEIYDAIQVFSKGTSINAVTFDGVFIYALAGSKVARFRASTGLVEGDPVDFGFPVSLLGFDGVNLYTVRNGDNWIIKF